MKVLLKDFTKMYQVGKRHLRGGELHELNTAELKQHSDIILAEIKPESKSAKKEEVTPKPTEKELFNLNKAEQVTIIEKLGLKPANLEADRVKQILENQ